MKTSSRQPSLLQALIPVIFLVGLLSFNVLGVYGNEALDGSNQMILLLSGFVAMLVGRWNKVAWNDLFNKVGESIMTSATAIIILLLIGALAASWLLGGVVPAMIYYGLEVLDPSYFLPASLIICAAVSLATGSSWSTTATMGIALIGIGSALGISEGLTAGAVISGAYFGDKMSPLSDTTNLAPAMAGAELFTHIRYMAYTTIPSIVIALIVFIFIGNSSIDSASVADTSEIMRSIKEHFYIHPILFLPPLGVILLIVKRVPAIPAILGGVFLGLFCSLFFQSDVILNLMGESSSAKGYYRVLMDTITQGVSIQTGDELLDELFSSSGMKGMLNTIWLILCAMVFGGAMEGAGLLQRISRSLLSLAKTDFALTATTTTTCVGINLTASDQYLSIVVPGRMYAEAYEKRGLAPENLSRTLEDSGTVTSVLIPWNTCGAYQSGVLGVATGTYLPYAIFNWLSPLMTLAFSYFNIRIARLKEEKAKN